MSDELELFRQLIRNACVNDGTAGSGHEIRSVETLTDFLGAAGDRFEPAEGRCSTVYRVPGTDPSAPTLMLMGHTDVVPVTSSSWSHDPFGAEVDDGFVWGRGAVDMLNLTAAMAVVFAPYLSGAIEPLPGDLVFLAVADEENAGGLGARPLVADHWDLVKTDVLLTEIAYPRFGGAEGVHPIAVGEKGPAWTTVRAGGVPGHGSVPFASENAAVKLVEALTGVVGTPTPAVVTEEWRRFVEAVGLPATLASADEIDAGLRELAATEPRLAAYIHACTHLTVSLNVIDAGTKANMVPDDARAQLDIRMLPGQGRADVDRFLAAAMGPHADRIELVPMADFPPTASPAEGILWDVLVDAIEQHTGSRAVAPVLMPASTDARFFRSRGVTAYGVGLFDDTVSFPDFLAMFHGNDERLSVGSFERTVGLFGSIVEGWRTATTR